MPRRTSLHLLLQSLLGGRCAGVLLSIALALSVGSVAAAQSPIGSSSPQIATSNSSDLPDAPQPQSANSAPSDPEDADAVTLRKTPVNILKDQAAIWTSPARIDDHSLAYLVPFVVATTLTITVDHKVMSSAKLDNPSLNSQAASASNGLLGGFVAVPVVIYGLGHIQHNDEGTETGILAGEAMVDSLVLDEAMKAVTRRERPTLDNARGKFFQSGIGMDSSFPSTHCMIAWSSAAVIASEYNSPFIKLTAYGLATGLSASRVVAREHFPSDVLVGSTVGWFVGRYVFHKHHRDDYDY
ncbi:MAG: phosphatase PAP2 family protein [Terracidiphilus sp.]|jgi:membrane-associated phospholipid phosphatase